MDLKTGRSSSWKKESKGGSYSSATNVPAAKHALYIAKSRRIEYQIAMGSITPDTWYVRANSEAVNGLSKSLGTGVIPVLDYTNTSLITYSEGLLDEASVIKNVKIAGVQQGAAGDRVIKVFIGYITMTPGVDILKGNLPALSSCGVSADFTSTDDWSLSSADLTAFTDAVIPANSLLIISVKQVSGPTNTCGISVNIDMEY